MISFSSLDIFIILLFFGIVLSIGFYSSFRRKDTAEDYLLSGRGLGIFLFVLTTVATWYGGILGVGEFTYRYGILSWFTQGFPYYVFAAVFAFFFASKIREASLFTIPDKIQDTYGRKAGILSAALIFVLVSPAPYLLMIGGLISIIFDISMFPALIVGILLSVVYMFKGGYRSDVLTDAFEFFVMFAGFIAIFLVSYFSFGGIDYLEANLPQGHMEIPGEASPVFIFVWFLIALWTFTDPGFHQRCYAAKDGKTAKYGILISIGFWALFDFLTTSVGLYARASMPEMSDPVLSFPLYAESILTPGIKGLFYAALIATVISTLNSFLFLSATTFGRDLVYKVKRGIPENKINFYTRTGLFVSALIAVVMAYYIDSVIELWYTIGSICIPGLILPVTGAYYNKFKISGKLVVIEIAGAVITSIIWLVIRPGYENYPVISQVEPMITGFLFAIVIHLYGILRKNKTGY